ncbi:phosphopantetheine-binding protein [Pseudonocardia xinjiangensis]|uniref:phosphopantetheine-binding protein n=1 Tax=Pseudonocardia xinjiangensis TaxID=75289 RepID=UPI001B7CDC2A|nr:phosphopantetheine-binding protein [Pseudonocardia xinjiangensis]
MGAKSTFRHANESFSPVIYCIPTRMSHTSGNRSKKPPSWCREGSRCGKPVEVLTADKAESPAGRREYGGPRTATEQLFAEVLADVAGLDRVSVDSHFFADLGTDSMVMARFCARARKRADLPPVSMKDIYQHPTIGTLARALASDDEPAPVQASTPAPVEVAKVAGRGEYVLCAALQLLTFLAYTYLAALVTERGYVWISGASGVLDLYLRSLVFGSAAMVGVCILPVLLKASCRCSADYSCSRLR